MCECIYVWIHIYICAWVHLRMYTGTSTDQKPQHQPCIFLAWPAVFDGPKFCIWTYQGLLQECEFSWQLESRVRIKKPTAVQHGRDYFCCSLCNVIFCLLRKKCSLIFFFPRQNNHKIMIGDVMTRVSKGFEVNQPSRGVRSLPHLLPLLVRSKVDD